MWEGWEVIPQNLQKVTEFLCVKLGEDGGEGAELAICVGGRLRITSGGLGLFVGGLRHGGVGD